MPDSHQDQLVAVQNSWGQTVFGPSTTQAKRFSANYYSGQLSADHYFQTYCVSDHILPRPGSDNQFGHFPVNFVSLLFQIYFFRNKQFQILPLDGGPQHLIHVNLVCFNLDKGFWNFVDIYCQIYPRTF